MCPLRMSAGIPPPPVSDASVRVGSRLLDYEPPPKERQRQGPIPWLAPDPQRASHAEGRQKTRPDPIGDPRFKIDSGLDIAKFFKAANQGLMERYGAGLSLHPNLSNPGANSTIGTRQRRRAGCG